jgi:hypothetical protein
VPSAVQQRAMPRGAAGQLHAAARRIFSCFVLCEPHSPCSFRLASGHETAQNFMSLRTSSYQFCARQRGESVRQLTAHCFLLSRASKTRLQKVASLLHFFYFLVRSFAHSQMEVRLNGLARIPTRDYSRT